MTYRMEGHVPVRENYGPDHEQWMGTCTSRVRYLPADRPEAIGEDAVKVEEYDYEPDPDKPGRRRIVRNPIPNERGHHLPLVKRSPQTQRALAEAAALQYIDSMVPRKITRKVRHTIVVECEVEIDAFGYVEAENAIGDRLSEIPAEEWVETVNYYQVADFTKRAGPIATPDHEDYDERCVL